MICKYCAKPMRDEDNGPWHMNDPDAVACWLERVAEGQLFNLNEWPRASCSDTSAL